MNGLKFRFNLVNFIKVFLFCMILITMLSLIGVPENTLSLIVFGIGMLSAQLGLPIIEVYEQEKEEK